MLYQMRVLSKGVYFLNVKQQLSCTPHGWGTQWGEGLLNPTFPLQLQSYSTCAQPVAICQRYGGGGGSFEILHCFLFSYYYFYFVYYKVL